ncbi:NUDIX hydrolase family protein [Bifidobacterium favimelis]|uniref:NUDIX hydrolase family protein n=1 Tax=Bifidobacterium favimelis TaxID=3122979 RepID=A0ABU8ZQU0_9BIFI
MPVLNDEIPDDDDFDAGRSRGEFSGVTPEDFMRGGEGGNPPGWLDRGDIERARRQLPIAYVEVVPVRVDEMGAVSQAGTLLCVGEDGNIGRTLITGRVLYHETIREALARNISKDLGELALPMLPTSPQPFTVAEFFPTPGVSEFYDPRQHAIALCYVVPVAGDCKPQDETLDVEWVDPRGDMLETFIGQMPNGHGSILRQALSWAGAL